MNDRSLRVLIALGAVSTVFYVSHLIVGHFVWPEYNMITTDISSLTADGAPYAGALRVLTILYGLCFVAFSIGMFCVAGKHHGRLVRTGYGMMLVLALTTSLGYGLFPLAEDKTVLNAQNILHLATTAVVALSALLSLYTLAIGYLRERGFERLGVTIMVAAISMTIFGLLNPVFITLNIELAGLAERGVIYTLLAVVTMLSWWYVRRPLRKL